MSQSRSVPLWCRCGVLVIVGWCLLAPLGAAEPPAKKMSPEERQAKLKERDRLWGEMQKLRDAGKMPEAIAAAENILVIERKLFGNNNDTVVMTLQWLAYLQEQREDIAAARKTYQEILNITMQLYGENDWRVTDARLDLEYSNLLARLQPEERKALDEANRLIERVDQQVAKGQSATAIPLAKKAVEARETILSNKHLRTGWAKRRLGICYRETGNYTQAEMCYCQDRDICKQVLGEKHPEYAASLALLAQLYDTVGDYARAEPLFRQAVEIYRQTLGEKHRYYTVCINDLALLYKEMGDYAKAEELLHQSLLSDREKLGSDATAVAIGLQNLASLHLKMKKYDQVEKESLESFEIWKKNSLSCHY